MTFVYVEKTFEILLRDNAFVCRKIGYMIQKNMDSPAFSKRIITNGSFEANFRLLVAKLHQTMAQSQ